MPLSDIAGPAGADGKDGKDGVGISGASLSEYGEIILTLTDGTHLNLGQIVSAGDSAPVSVTALSEQGGSNAMAPATMATSIVALLSHLGWLVPSLLRKKFPAFKKSG